MSKYITRRKFIKLIMCVNDSDDGNDDILLSLCMAVVPSALRGEGPPAEEVLP